MSKSAEKELAAPTVSAKATRPSSLRLSRPQALVLSVLVSGSIFWVLLIVLDTSGTEVYQACNATGCRFESRGSSTVRACTTVEWSLARSTDRLRSNRVCADEIPPRETVSVPLVAPPDLLARCISDGPCEPELVDTEVGLPPFRKYLFLGLWIASVVFVFVDARRHGTSGGSPLGYAIAVLLFWPFGLPIYLYRRLGFPSGAEAQADAPASVVKPITQAAWFSVAVVVSLFAVVAAGVLYVVYAAEARRVAEGHEVAVERQAIAEPTPTPPPEAPVRMEWQQVFHVAGSTTQTTEMFTLTGGGETRVRWRAQTLNGAMNFGFMVRGRDGAFHMGPNTMSSDAGETRIHGGNGEHYLNINVFNARYEIWVEQMRPALAMPTAPPAATPRPAPIPPRATPAAPVASPPTPEGLDPAAYARELPTLVHPRATLLYSSDSAARAAPSFTWRSGNASIVLEARIEGAGAALYRQRAPSPIAVWTRGPGLRTEITVNELSDGTALARLEDLAGNGSFGRVLVLRLDYDDRTEAISIIERWEGTSSAYWHDQAPPWTAMRVRRMVE